MYTQGGPRTQKEGCQPSSPAGLECPGKQCDATLVNIDHDHVYDTGGGQEPGPSPCSTPIPVPDEKQEAENKNMAANKNTNNGHIKTAANAPRQTGWVFPGHREYFGELSEAGDGKMMYEGGGRRGAFSGPSVGPGTGTPVVVVADGGKSCYVATTGTLGG